MGCNPKHSQQTVSDGIHIIYAFEYADAATRTAAGGFSAGDVGKVARQDDNNTFWILINNSPATWSEIGEGITAAEHETLRHLIHFIDDGPAHGFASGAYRETTGTVFPTAIIWYDKAGTGRKKIVSKEIVWSGPFPTTITWKMYDASETLLATVTDSISYTTPFETSRTRTIS